MAAARQPLAQRGWWLAASAACAAGLWLSGSRAASAAAAAVIPLAGLWSLSGRWPRKIRVAAAIVLVTLVAVVSWARLERLDRDPTYVGGGMREQFFATSLRMIATRPLFGVGAGRYYMESPLFLSPQLAITYAAENAHNYFLQLTAETGILGFSLFAAIVGGVVLTSFRALARSPRDFRLLGAVAGLIGFLATCVSGHPLLVREVALAFWAQLGLTAALAASTLMDSAQPASTPSRLRGRFTRIGTAVLVLVIVATIPVRAFSGRLGPARGRAVDGFYEWQNGQDGRRFRSTGEYASLFVPSEAVTVQIPVRVDSEHGPRLIDIEASGVQLGTFPLSSRWTTITLSLPPGQPVRRYKRIDFKVDRTWRPADILPGSTDTRELGAQVGDVVAMARVRGANGTRRP